jgi:hypothetical protein
MTDTFDYTKSLATADRLLAKFGQAVALRRVTLSGPSWDPVSTPADYVTVAAVIDYTAQQRQDASILVSDRRVLVSAGPLTALGVAAIIPGDTLVIGGVEVPVVISKPVNPAGVVVLYDVQCRF